MRNETNLRTNNEFYSVLCVIIIVNLISCAASRAPLSSILLSFGIISFREYNGNHSVVHVCLLSTLSHLWHNTHSLVSANVLLLLNEVTLFYLCVFFGREVVYYVSTLYLSSHHTQWYWECLTCKWMKNDERYH